MAVVLHPGCGESHRQNAWLIDDQTHYVQELLGREILVYTQVDSRYVLSDLFAKLQLNFGA